MTGLAITERLRRAAAEMVWFARELGACGSTCPFAAAPVGMGLPLGEAVTRAVTRG